MVLLYVDNVVAIIFLTPAHGATQYLLSMSRGNANTSCGPFHKTTTSESALLEPFESLQKEIFSGSI